MHLPSKHIEQAVQALASLPGIGKKTALRLALHLLNQPVEQVEQFGQAIVGMRRGVKFCLDCHNVADEERCPICLSSRRNREAICIVEGLRDLLAIENTQQYNGLYHILGGVISPIEGIGPADLNIESLLRRVQTGEVKEVIMAINPTIEGDTTIFYLSRQLREFGVKVSTIARGVAFGGEIEYADELTLGRSILARIPYDQ
jgi:recombination protein RecR